MQASYSVYAVYNKLFHRFFKLIEADKKEANYQNQLAGKSTTLLLFHGESKTAPY